MLSWSSFAIKAFLASQVRREISVFRVKALMSVIFFLYLVRNLFNGKLFSDISIYALGDVLDVGGGSFYKRLMPLPASIASWTIVIHALRVHVLFKGRHLYAY